VKPAGAVLKQYWGSRTRRERAIATSAAALAALAALVFLLLVPGLAARRELAASLPRLRAQVEDMRAQADEIAALRKKLAAAPRSADLAALVRSSASRTSFAAALERVEGVAGGKVLLLAKQADFDEWLAWTETLQREFGIRLETCRIAALEQSGFVRVEAVLVPPRADAVARQP
jgi:type II secretory pathway component PulM